MTILWEASQQRKESTLMHQLMVERGFSSYKDLHKWSVEQREEFWSLLFNKFEVTYDGSLSPALQDDSFIDYPWFPNIKLNFAENLLRFKNSSNTALNFKHESGLSKKLSYQQLYAKVEDVSDYLSNIMNQEDVLAAYMPNCPETVIAMLACSAVGGIFTSTSADFGVQGVIDRFGQSKPKVLVAACGYEYNGKYYDLAERIEQIRDQIPSIEKVILVDLFAKGTVLSDCEMWSDIPKASKHLNFVRRAFNAPQYIMYSSGTTGKPKCIVHSQGGTLLQHIKELGLHCDLSEEKSIFYFTTCGWMMWNWLVSSLYFGAEIVLYEGSPAYPSFKNYMNILKTERVNIWGTSPKFLRALEIHAADLQHDYPDLETILSTGAPLLPEQFDYVYDTIKSDVLLGSISGGTDIIGCFMLANPIMPVHRGEIQCFGLGMDVDCVDDNCSSVQDREGELICRQSFVSQPIYFLEDSDSSKLKKAYFDRFEGIWHHGDFITVTQNNGVIVHGRSDATLNPGGVRIGTAEIYRQTERLSFIDDSLCVGKQADGDVDVWLFVKLKEGESLDQARIKEIKDCIKQNTTPRHVPKVVHAVSDIPYTRSGKKMELAVTKVLNGKALDNIEAMANPESIKQYQTLVQFEGSKT